jgi:hypothetical protein
VQAGTAGRRHVLAHQSVVQRRRQLLEDLGVLTDKPEERRPPRRQRDRVDQSERAIAGAVQQTAPPKSWATTRGSSRPQCVKSSVKTLPWAARETSCPTDISDAP